MFPLHSFSNNRLGFALLLLGVTVLTACEPMPVPPTLAPALALRATVVPAATVGPLASAAIPEAGVTLMTPTSWKPPVAISDAAAVISPTGSTDTTYSAGVFMLVGDAHKLAKEKLTFNFRDDISDPVQQLTLLLAAINLDAPNWTTAEVFSGAQYPAAVSVGFDRDNELTIVLINAGNNRWIYVGTQAPERNYTYYNSAVFEPAIASITPATP